MILPPRLTKWERYWPTSGVCSLGDGVIGEIDSTLDPFTLNATVLKGLILNDYSGLRSTLLDLDVIADV